MAFPQNSFFGNVLPYQGDFLLKTKMVRVVHMNIFYRMDLEFCDPKSEFWTKTENGSCSSISQFKTDETGSFSNIFLIPINSDGISK